PSPLDDEEWELMRTHPVVGERILAPIEALAGVVPIVRSSHERWDGGGYPDGLRGDAIPIGARIVAVCDAYRALVEPRPYRPPLQLAGLRQLLHDVGAADQLAPHEDLRDRRPAGDGRELQPDARVGQDVDGRHRRARLPERAKRPVGVAAHDELRRALHEERDRLVLDDLLDRLAKLAHSVPLVVIRSS